MKFGLSQKDIRQILSVFKKNPHVKEVIIFGSRAMGNYKKGSDVDLAIKGKLNPGELSHLKSVLEEDLPIPYVFDLVEYREIESPELKDHIDTYGKIFT